MRLWTLHPKYLDRIGLVAVWREALLAQKVLQGATEGYRNHPQLTRFRAQPDPPACIGSYLEEVLRESVRRGYRFDPSKIGEARAAGPIAETEGQLQYEWQHLLGKLKARSPGSCARLAKINQPESHPLFATVPGGVAEWERV